MNICLRGLKFFSLKMYDLILFEITAVGINGKMLTELKKIRQDTLFFV